MSARRALALTASSALLAGLAVAGSPGAGATPAPTPEQLAQAQRDVADAREDLTDLQVQAERAAEAYNGAQVEVAQAVEVSNAAAAASAVAAATSVQAAGASAEAQASAQSAAAEADRARAAHEQAVRDEQVAQDALDAVAAGAYRSGGTLAKLSAMLDSDPLTFATNREVLNRVDEHNKDTADRLAAAKRLAADSAAAATSAEQAASAQATQVAATAEAAAAAAAAARTASAAAADAAALANSAAEQAAAARQRAEALVARAEAALGSATANAAGLAAKAEQAKREAAAARRLPITQGAPVDGSAAAVAIAAAYSQIGVPYSWGGGTAAGPSRGFAQGANTIGFDCSGLTLYAYAKAGVRLPHYTGAQWEAGRRVTRAELAPGDLMFFSDDGTDSGIHHVSIYLGNGLMIHAPHTGDVVKVSSAARSDFIGGVRLTG